MKDESPPTVPRTVWAYAYEMDPPQPTDRMGAVRILLDRAHADAKQDTRSWEGRFVVEPQITHILIVSDDPEQDSEVNGRLEDQLRDIQAGFFRTAPLAVPDDPEPDP